MSRYIILLLFTCFLTQTYSQRTRTAQTFKSTQAQLIRFESNIVNQDNDRDAVKIIKSFYSIKDAIYDHRINAINSYNEELTDKEKKRKYIAESKDDQDLKRLQEDLSDAELQKREYLSMSYPEYQKIVSKLGKSKKSRT